MLSLKKFANFESLFRVDCDPNHLIERGANDQKKKTIEGLTVFVLVGVERAVYSKVKWADARDCNRLFYNQNHFKKLDF